MSSPAHLCVRYSVLEELRVIYVVVLFLNMKDEVYRLWQNRIKEAYQEDDALSFIFVIFLRSVCH